MATIDDDKTLPLQLNLEESGMLCHCLMRAFQDSTYLQHANIRSALDVDPAKFAKRMRQLYLRLSDVNDSLMGKGM